MFHTDVKGIYVQNSCISYPSLKRKKKKKQGKWFELRDECKIQQFLLFEGEKIILGKHI